MPGTKKGEARARNVVLADLLAELGWSHTRATAEINAFMGPGYVGRSSVAEWVINARIPHEPLPTVVAHMLSEATGRTITVTDLWGAGVKQSALWLPANHGHHMTRWDYPGVLHTAHDWITNVGRAMDTDRRQFMAISGAVLTAGAWAYLDTPASAAIPNTPTGAHEAMKVTPAIVDALETAVSGLRRLDDKEGGNRHTLRLAHRTFQTVAEYVQTANTSDATTHRRLLNTWANLCQITGWMAVDADQHGLAQRYFRTGLQIAHVTKNRDLGANILSFLTLQATYRGAAKDAIALGSAAMEAAKGTSPVVQALVTCWYAEAQAVNGDSYTCHDAIDKARKALNASDALATRPDHLYWFDSDALERNVSHSLLVLAQTISHKRDYLLDYADKAVAPQIVANSLYPREALFHGTWLARSYIWRNELEQAVHTGEVCLELARRVRSPRATALLRQFTKELQQHSGARNNPQTAELAHQLAAISHTTA